VIVFIASDSEPALEKATNVKVAPYNFAYPLISQHFEETKLGLKDPQNNKWSQVFDFTPDEN
jgi:protein XRP2